MKKKLVKKIALHRETIRNLTESQLEVPAGGAPTVGANCNTLTDHSCDRTCTC